VTATPPTRLQRTTERLCDAALRLFEERGYDQTTVADIAHAAGVTPMTFYRHFGSKEALVVDDPFDPMIVAAVAAQPPQLPALARAIGGLEQAWHTERVDPADLRRRLAIIAATPSLRPATVANTQRTQSLIADQLRRDGSDPLTAEVASAAIIAALTTALLSWATSPAEDPSDAVTTALAVLKGADA
jgi:AcrR family transcriptional regulator